MIERRADRCQWTAFVGQPLLIRDEDTDTYAAQRMIADRQFGVVNADSIISSDGENVTRGATQTRAITGGERSEKKKTKKTTGLKTQVEEKEQKRREAIKRGARYTDIELSAISDATNTSSLGFLLAGGYSRFDHHPASASGLSLSLPSSSFLLPSTMNSSFMFVSP